MKQSQYNVWYERDGKAYVYNGTTGSLLAMSMAERRQLRESPAALQSELLTKLAHGRMIIADDTDELQLLEARYAAGRNNRKHFGLTIVTSLGCNFDCPYCFEAKHPSILGEKVQDAIIRMLEERLPLSDSFAVTWYGGEPLVGKRPLLALSDTFIELCNRCEVEYSASIITNGFLLDRDTARQLSERHIPFAQVTLDGPPEIHNKMRPLAGGGGTFDQIVENIRTAIEFLTVSVRVNIDRGNIDRVEDMLRILSDAGLAGRISVNPAQLVASDYSGAEPSASYSTACFQSAEYAQVALGFQELTRQYGFSGPSLPEPTTTPCTAVNRNELVVGSKGELYKCWESVGNAKEIVGSIFDYDETDSRLAKWLRYSPFDDSECRTCIALPVCMGGCATHAMSKGQYENRCGTFRHTYKEQVETFVTQISERPGLRRPLPIVAVN